MRPKCSSEIHTDILFLIVATLALLAQPSGNADEATVSREFADVAPMTYAENIDKRHAAFKAMLGARPISLVGAEIDSIDLGEAGGRLFGDPADVSIKGAAAFGVLYRPVPIMDVYLIIH